MTKRIFRSILGVSLAVLLASLVLIVGVLHGYFQDRVSGELESLAEYIAHGVEENGTDYLTEDLPGSYRITWVDADGTVLFDNRQDPEEMGNHAQREEIREAARQAEIYDDIMAMPDGFDTYVGERGTLLSGGQKQRVSIARIFLKNPPILILDEATSALDSVTESKIQHALDHLAEGRTTLIIAHRLSTIRSASRILVVADGRICEQGTHEELMCLGGLYATLRSTQDLSSAE